MNFRKHLGRSLLCSLILTGAISTAQADTYDDGLMAFAIGNFQEAGRLFTKAAHDGHAGAEHMLMRLYSEGKLYAANGDAEALHWTRQAAEHGFALAQFALAESYVSHGKAAAAVEWYRKAMAQGHHGAYYKLGLLLAEGTEGVPSNQAESRRLLGIAASEYDVFAQMGDPAAQTTLASMYEKAQGVRKDMNLAMQWYDRAARQGFALAQLNLGRLYVYGDAGVPRDPQQATYWLDLAAAQGLREAKTLLGELQGRDKAQIAMAL